MDNQSFYQSALMCLNSLWDWHSFWTQTVEPARQHLDSFCDICFPFHILQCHIAARMAKWHSAAMNQPPKTFYSFNRRHAGQGNEITLPSFILSQNLLQICPVLSSVFPSVTLLHSPFLSFSLGLLAWKLSVSKMKFPNCCKWLAICVNGWDEKSIIIIQIQRPKYKKMGKWKCPKK